MPQVECPSCGHKGKALKPVTLNALLTPVARSRVGTADGYRHCAQPRCDVVYFHTELQTTFSTKEIRVRVGTKATTSPRPVCYCFGHSWESIQEELALHGKVTLIEDITAECRAGRDRCPEENPQGSCCLGNVRRAVKEGIAALGIEPVAPSTSANCCSQNDTSSDEPLSCASVYEAPPADAYPSKE